MPLLLDIFEPNEAEIIVDMVQEHINNNHLDISQTEDILQELLSHKPIQYITQRSYFSDFELFIDENVLIPRPETDELADMIIKLYKTNDSELKIIDIGTGSGCIALALKKHLKNSTVTAIDISEASLNVAKKNASILKLEISFYLDNILNPKNFPTEKYDIIVSNPPYILPNETLDKHVLKEPRQALFVTNNDPLQFYKAIEDFSAIHLSNKGQVFLELHKDYAEEVNHYWQDKSWFTQLKKDMQGNDRFLIANR